MSRGDLPIKAVDGLKRRWLLVEAAVLEGLARQAPAIADVLDPAKADLSW